VSLLTVIFACGSAFSQSVGVRTTNKAYKSVSCDAEVERTMKDMMALYKQYKDPERAVQQTSVGVDATGETTENMLVRCCQCGGGGACEREKGLPCCNS